MQTMFKYWRPSTVLKLNFCTKVEERLDLLRAKLKKGQSVYLPPDPTIESGMVEILSDEFETCEIVRKEVEKHRSQQNS